MLTVVLRYIFDIQCHDIVVLTVCIDIVIAGIHEHSRTSRRARGRRVGSEQNGGYQPCALYISFAGIAWYRGQSRGGYGVAAVCFSPSAHDAQAHRS